MLTLQCWAAGSNQELRHDCDWKKNEQTHTYTPCGNFYIIWNMTHVHTSSELFFRVTDFPSKSISSIVTLPVASASWLMWILGALPTTDSSISTRFLFERVVREELLLPVARETVTLADGLGDSWSLERGRANTQVIHCIHLKVLNIPQCISFFTIESCQNNHHYGEVVV